MKNCIFCQIVKKKAGSWKVFENKNVYAFLDIHPVNEYHTLIIPKKHYTDIFDVPEKELKRVMSGLKKVVDLYHKKLGLRNVQIVNSSGVAAQQDVFHVHFHIVPRKSGDNQNVVWKPHPEFREKFDRLLEKLK